MVKAPLAEPRRAGATDLGTSAAEADGELGAGSTSATVRGLSAAGRAPSLGLADLVTEATNFSGLLTWSASRDSASSASSLCGKSSSRLTSAGATADFSD